MDTSETRRSSVDEVDLLLANAKLRDELEPYRDESIENDSVSRMPLQLENEYLEALARLRDRGDEGAEIQQYTMSRMSLRTGRRMPYVYDKPIPLPEGFALSVANGVVSVTWGIVYDEYFNYYELQRSTSPQFPTTFGVYASSDNHDNTFLDTVGAGQHYYRLLVYNSNDLVSYTDTASVVLP